MGVGGRATVTIVYASTHSAYAWLKRRGSHARYERTGLRVVRTVFLPIRPSLVNRKRTRAQLRTQRLGSLRNDFQNKDS